METQLLSSINELNNSVKKIEIDPKLQSHYLLSHLIAVSKLTFSTLNLVGLGFVSPE